MKTVLAHGCFDLLHLGHIRHLQEARKLGDELVVSVTADKYVNKGLGRPRFTDDERAEALKALSCVDRVMINHAADAVGIIQHIKPAVYVKGADYCGSDDVILAKEATAVHKAGGDLVFTSTRKWSSTELLNNRVYDDYREGLGRVECDVDHSIVAETFRNARVDNSRLFFIGNGGSAAIASHMAADFQKAAKIPSICFNDASQLTALANDIGFHSVFAEPIKMHGRQRDMLIAISSSGESDSILDAVYYADRKHMRVITLSGFNPANRLRKLGSYNFYVPSRSYGVVECTHQTILHSLLDAVVGPQ